MFSNFKSLPKASAMKAAVVSSFNEPLHLKHIEIPAVGTGQVLVKLVASGVCHSDVHIARGDLFVNSPLPIIPGHEGTGVVAEVGEGVTSLRKGDRVGVSFLSFACGACDYCTSGCENYCPSIKAVGYTINGCYAEYVLTYAAFAVKLPDNLDFVEFAPILCAGTTSYKAIKEIEAKPGSWISVIGIGGLGHLAVQYAKAMGLNVVAIDTRPQSLDLAKQFGADMISNAASENSAAKVTTELGGVHGSVIIAPAISAFEQGVQMLRRNGTAVYVGLPKENISSVNIFDLILCGKKIKGTLLGTRQDTNEAFAFAAEGKIRVQHTVDSLDNINEVFARMDRGEVQGRVVLSI